MSFLNFSLFWPQKIILKKSLSRKYKFLFPTFTINIYEQPMTYFLVNNLCKIIKQSLWRIGLRIKKLIFRAVISEPLPEDWDKHPVKTIGNMFSIRFFIQIT